MGSSVDLKLNSGCDILTSLEVQEMSIKIMLMLLERPDIAGLVVDEVARFIEKDAGRSLGAKQMLN
ncbi:hypothetical protein [Pseudochelatococcus sp. G4_1912]|uniref:hypothetical protein n=1 Tax=Pseudochelatococcus sp. G4_1912 TaxID=3114288 RepID=UPI0039C6D68A